MHCFLVLPPLLFEMRLLGKKTSFGKALERSVVGSFSPPSDLMSRDMGGPVELLSVEWKFLAGLPLHLLKCEGEEWSLGKGVENLYRIFSWTWDSQCWNWPVAHLYQAAGVLEGAPRDGGHLWGTHICPRKKTNLACPVQRAPKHNIMSSAKQELIHFPYHPAESRGREESPPFFLLCQS